ncbi:hypothetical protein POUND7_003507 [Theobroma cacao]
MWLYVRETAEVQWVHVGNRGWDRGVRDQTQMRSMKENEQKLTRRELEDKLTEEKQDEATVGAEKVQRRNIWMDNRKQFMIACRGQDDYLNFKRGCSTYLGANLL